LASLIFLVFYVVVVDFDRRDGGIEVEGTGNYLSKLQLLEFYSTEAEDAKESETTNQCK